MNPKNFGPNLKILLDTLGITQLELSKRTGLVPAAISHLINNRRDPSLKTICKILSVIPVTFEKLMEPK